MVLQYKGLTRPVLVQNNSLQVHLRDNQGFYKLNVCNPIIVLTATKKSLCICFSVHAIQILKCNTGKEEFLICNLHTTSNRERFLLHKEQQLAR